MRSKLDVTGNKASGYECAIVPTQEHGTKAETMSFQATGAASVRRLIHYQTRVVISRISPLRTAVNTLACRRSVSVSSERSFSAATAVHAKESTATAASDKKKDDSNIFLDNLGKIFLGAIGLLIGTLVRSSYGTSNRNKVRDELEEKASLDPLEVDDLRVANSELSPDVFRDIMEDVQDTFPLGVATYQDFVRSVRKTMSRLKGDAFTVELGHLLDRAVIAALHEQGKSEDAQVPLTFLLAALSLALNSSVEDRIHILFDATRLENGNVAYEDVRNMVGYLQDTCQLVPDAQVVQAEQKYPTQKYKRGTPKQLVQWEGGSQDAMDVDAFAAIIRSKSVCAWGECYKKKKKPA
jgi:hypothetical protein